MCGGPTCGSCPAISAGCDGCNCQAPRHAKPAVPVRTIYIQKKVSAGTDGCAPGVQSACGGFTVMPSYAVGPFVVEAPDGLDHFTDIIVVFEFAAPLPGPLIYLQFGPNSGIMPGTSNPFAIKLQNCSTTQWRTCTDKTSASCFTKDTCTDQSGHAVGVIGLYVNQGDGGGVYLMNPGTRVVTVTLTADWATNAVRAQFWRNSVSLFHV
jgi:hypothetical protein